MSKDVLTKLSSNIGEFIEYWGFKSIHGKIWVYLFLNEEAMSSRELKEKLGISKALLSMSLTELKKHKVVLEAGHGKYGAEMVMANPNVMEAILFVIRSREKAMINSVTDEINKLLELDSDYLKEHNISPKRLKTLKKLTNYANKAIGGFLKLDSIVLQKWKQFRST